MTERKRDKDRKNMRDRDSERQKKIEKKIMNKKKGDDLFPVVRFGDVSELLLDAVAINVLEVEGPRGGSGQTAPFGGVPTGGHRPHRVHAGSLNFFDGFLDGIEAVQQSRVRLAEADVQQLSVVTLVLHQGKVGSFVSEEHHLDWILEGGLSPVKARDFGSDRKALPDETDLTSSSFQFTVKI